MQTTSTSYPHGALSAPPDQYPPRQINGTRGDPSTRIRGDRNACRLRHRYRGHRTPPAALLLQLVAVLIVGVDLVLCFLEWGLPAILLLRPHLFRHWSWRHRITRSYEADVRRGERRIRTVAAPAGVLIDWSGTPFRRRLGGRRPAVGTGGCGHPRRSLLSRGPTGRPLAPASVSICPLLTHRDPSQGVLRLYDAARRAVTA